MNIWLRRTTPLVIPFESSPPRIYNSIPSYWLPGRGDETPRDRTFAAAARLAAETFNLPGAATWAAENEGAWTDATATAESEVPPNLATEDTAAWINSGMARWN